MSRTSLFLSLVCIQALVAGAANAQISVKEFIPEMSTAPMAEREGLYAKLGLAINVPEVEGANIDVTAGAGISVAGGYRLNEWLAAELDFTLTGGHLVEFRGQSTDDDLVYLAVIGGAKVYPFVFFDFGLPDWVEPYGFLGIGGASIMSDVSEDGAFIARIAGGAEFPIFDRAGVYFEVGGDLGDESGLDGVTRIVLGGSYRF